MLQHLDVHGPEDFEGAITADESRQSLGTAAARRQAATQVTLEGAPALNMIRCTSTKSTELSRMTARMSSDYHA